jgi:AcrR family transcriptional regulator
VPAERGPRARMRKTLLTTAMGLMEEGLIPSVSAVAEAAEVSRATAYRYFPSEAAMIEAAVKEALGPILAWTPDSPDAEERISELLAFAYPRMEKYEATLRAALWLALDHWARRQAKTIGAGEAFVRGHRKALLAKVAAPLRGRLSRQAIDKLTQSLSLIFGTEAIVVLKDIWGLDGAEAKRVAIWASHALVRTAISEASENGQARPTKNRRRNAAARPRGRGN